MVMTVMAANTVGQVSQQNGPVVSGMMLTGPAVRMLVLHHLRGAGRALSVAELVRLFAGVELSGRASKVISDSLRTEVSKGRVVRVRRGVYKLVSMGGSHVRRVGLFVRGYLEDRWRTETGGFGEMKRLGPVMRRCNTEKLWGSREYNHTWVWLR